MEFRCKCSPIHELQGSSRQKRPHVSLFTSYGQFQHNESVRAQCIALFLLALSWSSSKRFMKSCHGRFYQTKQILAFPKLVGSNKGSMDWLKQAPTGPLCQSQLSFDSCIHFLIPDDPPYRTWTVLKTARQNRPITDRDWSIHATKF